MNSYQKQKLRISQLEKDIHTLVTKGDSIEGLTLKISYQLKYDIDKSIWFGDATKFGDIKH